MCTLYSTAVGIRRIFCKNWKKLAFLSFFSNLPATFAEDVATTFGENNFLSFFSCLVGNEQNGVDWSENRADQFAFPILIVLQTWATLMGINRNDNWKLDMSTAVLWLLYKNNLSIQCTVQ